jgi:polyferredoxin
MPFQGSTYKKVVIYVNALVNATSTSYTFPTAFTKTPAITYVPSGDAALITLSTTVVTFAVGTFVSGFVTIEGY